MWTEIKGAGLENDETIWVMLLEIENHMNGCVMHQPVENWTGIGSGVIDALWVSRWGTTWLYNCSLEQLNGYLQNGPSAD
eukprot:11378983-Ditylum_brightwellii.AAC.1